MIEIAGKLDEMLDSHLRRFQVQEIDGELILRPSFVKAGDMLKKPTLTEQVEITFEQMTELSKETSLAASNKKKEVALSLIDLLKKRFADFDNDVYLAMNWFDPKNWLDEREYGEEN